MNRVFVDVDGTLIGIDDGVRPWVKEMFRELSKKFRVIVWSGGGRQYAENWVGRLGVGEYVDDAREKFDFDRFNIGQGDYCIDDEESVVFSFRMRGGEGFTVPFYDELNEDEVNKNVLKNTCELLINS